jgi:hypothetical protein
MSSAGLGTCFADLDSVFPFQHLGPMIPLPHSRAAWCAVMVATCLACGGGGSDAKTAQAGSGKSSGPCRATLEQAVGLAVSQYVKGAKPKPERFLVSAGTDSALGDAGLVALQDKGPTYLYPGDAALQAQVRGQLHAKGDYTTLLVVRKAAASNDGSASVSLAGHYVGGESDGQHVDPRSYRFACADSVWQLKDSSAVERSS